MWLEVVNIRLSIVNFSGVNEPEEQWNFFSAHFRGLDFNS